ncbi:hypothetical protein D3C78_1858440 [compost metagenome]
MAGKPRPGSITPGVENIKLKVVKNSPADKAPPIKESFGDSRRPAISTPMEISRTPSKLENRSTLKML